MAKFQNKQNGRIAELLETREKFKTVQVQFLDTNEVRDFSLSTWKRWWKELPEEEVVEETPVEEVQEEDVASDGTPYSQVMEEILQDEKVAAEKKTKKEKKEKKPATVKPDVAQLFEDVNALATNNGFEYYTREKQPSCYNYRIGEGKVKFIVKTSRNGLQLFVKSHQIPKECAKKLETATGFFDKRLVIDKLDDDSKKLINSIIDSFKEA